MRDVPILSRLLLAGLLVCCALPATAQDTALSDRAKRLDANGNGVIDRGEARGPLADGFDAADCDKSGGLDGAEIRGFFQGSGCPGPKGSAAASAPRRDPKALRGRAYASDTNGNGVLERDEAGGPLAASFDKVDADGNGVLDGQEIGKFFRDGGGRPAGTAPAGGRPPPSGRRARPPPRVVLDAVRAEPVTQTFPVIGRLVALQSGVVASQVAGALTDLRVDVGDRVERGQVIAAIAADRLEADRNRYAAAVARQRAMLTTARAEYEKKQHEFRRLQRLEKSAAFSRARYEDLERDVQSRKGAVEERQAQLAEARAQLQRAEIDLRDTRIKAPFPGVVSEKHTEVGSYLGVGARIVTVINDRGIEIEADVPTDRLGGIPLGTAVRARFENGQAFDTTVRAVVPEVNIRTRTRPVRFRLAPAAGDRRLAANQSVTVEIPVITGKQVVTVHKDAIVRDGKRAMIFRVEDGMAVRRLVRLGDAVGRRFVVLEGLVPGQRVVVRGNETLQPGSRVTVVETAGG